MKAGFLRAALVLGLLQAIGPFAIDMYLPALPSIGQSLGAGIDAVQASLMVFFIALAVGQLLYGPVSDMVGRKLPLYFGLGLFALASVGCAMATDVQMLIVFRFIQGLGACACFAIPRADRQGPAHRRRCGAADVAADAGVQRRARSSRRWPAASSTSGSAGAASSGRSPRWRWSASR